VVPPAADLSRTPPHDYCNNRAPRAPRPPARSLPRRAARDGTGGRWAGVDDSDDESCSDDSADNYDAAQRRRRVGRTPTRLDAIPGLPPHRSASEGDSADEDWAGVVQAGPIALVAAIDGVGPPRLPRGPPPEAKRAEALALAARSRPLRALAALAAQVEAEADAADAARRRRSVVAASTARGGAPVDAGAIVGAPRGSTPLLFDKGRNADEVPSPSGPGSVGPGPVVVQIPTSRHLPPPPPPRPAPPDGAAPLPRGPAAASALVSAAARAAEAVVDSDSSPRARALAAALTTLAVADLSGGRAVSLVAVILEAVLGSGADMADDSDLAASPSSSLLGRLEPALAALGPAAQCARCGRGFAPLHPTPCSVVYRGGAPGEPEWRFEGSHTVHGADVRWPRAVPAGWSFLGGIGGAWASNAPHPSPELASAPLSSSPEARKVAGVKRPGGREDDSGSALEPEGAPGGTPEPAEPVSPSPFLSKRPRGEGNATDI